MMFRRSLIDLVFPQDDETFRLHMDFYVVVMAQMVAGSLLIDEALYSYRLHGRNGAADNPVLGGRLHLSSRNWGNTYAEMLARMLSAMQRRPRALRHCPGRTPVSPNGHADESGPLQASNLFALALISYSKLVHLATVCLGESGICPYPALAGEGQRVGSALRTGVCV